MIKQKTFKQYHNIIEKDFTDIYETIDINNLINDNIIDNKLIIDMYDQQCNQRKERIKEELLLFKKEDCDLVNEKINKFNKVFDQGIKKDKYQCINIERYSNNNNYSTDIYENKLKLLFNNTNVIEKGIYNTGYELIMTISDKEKIIIGLSEKYISINDRYNFCENSIINEFLCKKVESIISKHNKFFKELYNHTYLFHNFINQIPFVNEIANDHVNIFNLYEEIEILKIKYDLLQTSEKKNVKNHIKP